jgi:hypothetical protein
LHFQDENRDQGRGFCLWADHSYQVALTSTDPTEKSVAVPATYPRAMSRGQRNDASFVIPCALRRETPRR